MEIKKIDSLGINSPVQKIDNNDMGNNFGDFLKKSMSELNTMQHSADNAIGDMATGQVKDLRQAALAINKAEVSMKLMLEVRNKAVNAYKEILRTQV